MARLLVNPSAVGNTALFSESCDLPIHALVQRASSRLLSYTDIMRSCANRVLKCDSHLFALSESYLDEAMRESAEAEERLAKGEPLSPLRGIPVLLKDLIDVEGKTTRAGSLTRKDVPAKQTATCVQRLRSAGMIVLGKTNTVEFAMGAWGTNKSLGTPRNPWSAKRHFLPGGSSSGSAVAVAAGFAPAALGTDTGGSVRLPAAFCGLVGLKPTNGQISLQGVLPLAPTLDTVGPIVRSVLDAAVLLDTMSGEDSLDSKTIGRKPTDTLATIQDSVEGLRVATLSASERRGVDEEVLAAYDASIDHLRNCGVVTAPLELPYSFASTAQLTFSIIATEGYASHRTVVDDESSPLDPDVRTRFLAGRDKSAADYMADLAAAACLKKELLAALSGFDALLLPTHETPAFEVEKIDHSTSPTRFTRFANLFGLCAISIPNGISSKGMPLSLQIVGRPFDDALILRLGWAYERSTPWNALRPPVSGA